MTERRIADVALVATIGVFWGLNWPAVRIILTEIPPLSMRAIGFSAGAVALVALARMRGSRLAPRPAEGLRLVAAGLLTVLGFNVLTAYGQLLTETSIAAIIAFTMPMWAALLSAVFLAERLGPMRVVSLLAGMLGLLVLVAGDLDAMRSAPLGPAVMLGAAVSWAAGTVVLKSGVWSIGSIARGAWMLGCSALPTIACAWLIEGPFSPRVPSASVAVALAYHVVFPMAVCYASWAMLVSRLPASTAAVGTLLIPVVGVLSAVALLGEPLTASKCAALALIVASIAATFATGPSRR